MNTLDVKMMREFIIFIIVPEAAIKMHMLIADEWINLRPNEDIHVY